MTTGTFTDRVLLVAENCFCICQSKVKLSLYLTVLSNVRYPRVANLFTARYCSLEENTSRMKHWFEEDKADVIH